MTNWASPRGSLWKQIRSVEELLAVIARVDDRRRVIRVQAWHEGDFGAIYAEATAMRDELDWLREALSERWTELHKARKAETDD